MSITNQIKVSINNQQRQTVRSVGLGTLTTVTRLSQLSDVDVSGTNNNEVLVYDSSVQKYVIKPLPSVDGGFY